mgnify:CR=1 FL=1
MKLDFRFLGIRLDTEQRKAFLIIGLLIFFALISKTLFYNMIEPKVYTFSEEEKEILASLNAYTPLEAQYDKKIYQKNFYNRKNSNDKRFNKKWFEFNPNTIEESQLRKLPLPDYVINNILKYKSTGATFRNAEQFSKIYGIAPYFDELRPYLVIESNTTKKVDKVNELDEQDKIILKDTSAIAESAQTEILRPQKYENIIVEINEANIYQLMQVRGIGEWSAKKLLEGRDKLGGYIHKEQIYEISGIPVERLDQFIDFIKIDDSKIKKWKINFARDREVYQHPYFTNKQAKILLLYRMHHNGIKNIDQLRDVKVFTEEEIKRLEPYLDFSI